MSISFSDSFVKLLQKRFPITSHPWTLDNSFVREVADIYLGCAEDFYQNKTTGEIKVLKARITDKEESLQAYQNENRDLHRKFKETDELLIQARGVITDLRNQREKLQTSLKHALEVNQSMTHGQVENYWWQRWLKLNDKLAQVKDLVDGVR